MALFVLSSKDGWVNIMYTGLDAVGVDMQPIENYNEWRLLYFISFLLLVAFFVLNMFVGVVVENFHRCREQQEAEERARRAEKRARKLEKRRKSMALFLRRLVELEHEIALQNHYYLYNSLEAGPLQAYHSFQYDTYNTPSPHPFTGSSRGISPGGGGPGPPPTPFYVPFPGESPPFLLSPPTLNDYLTSSSMTGSMSQMHDQHDHHPVGPLPEVKIEENVEQQQDDDEEEQELDEAVPLMSANNSIGSCGSLVRRNNELQEDQSGGEQIEDLDEEVSITLMDDQDDPQHRLFSALNPPDRQFRRLSGYNYQVELHPFIGTIGPRIAGTSGYHANHHQHQSSTQPMTNDYSYESILHYVYSESLTVSETGLDESLTLFSNPVPEPPSKHQEVDRCSTSASSPTTHHHQLELPPHKSRAKSRRGRSRTRRGRKRPKANKQKTNKDDNGK